MKEYYLFDSENKNPFFSVIITSYNREKLIERALNSLIQQDFQDWEAIIIDDGSTDDTFSVVKNYCLNDNRFKYIFQFNSGPASAKNTGARFSAGRFIAFLDSDDEYMPEHLSIRYNHIINNPGIEFFYGGVKIIGNEYVPDVNDKTKLINLKDCYIGGSFIIKRELFQRLGMFPETKFGEDYFLIKKAEEMGINIMKLYDETYIYHRDSEDSVCDNI